MKHNNPMSFVSYKIIVLDFIQNDDFENPKNQIATATGFLYKRNDSFYLITNWHVINERNFWNKKVKHSERRPSHLLFSPSYSENDTTVVKDNRAILLDLYDESGNPKWLIHPKWKNDIDVIAIPVSYTNNLLAINDIQKALHLDLSITDELFVIGYPYGQGSDQKGTLPIWKKCTVASEPDMNFLSDNRPTFLIDGITNPSMSGSPVIRFINSSINTPNGMILTSPGIELFGVYSGRISAYTTTNPHEPYLDFDLIIKEIQQHYDQDLINSFCGSLKKSQDLIEKFVKHVTRQEIENDSKIGLVWKSNLIDEIIDGGKKDTLIYDKDLYINE